MHIEIVFGDYIASSCQVLRENLTLNKIQHKLHKIRDSRNDRWAFVRINGKRVDDDQLPKRLSPRKKLPGALVVLVAIGLRLLAPHPAHLLAHPRPALHRACRKRDSYFLPPPAARD